MSRATRIVPLAVLAIMSLDACRRRPEPAATPVDTTPAAPTCGPACQDSIARARAREDSIARANAERDRLAREREAAIAAARSALTATIYFDYDRSDITPDARAKLDAKVPVLSQNPNLRIRIAGHTDSRGSDEYNLALGQRRAAAAKRYLTDRGVDGNRIEIVSFGEERGACTEEAESCWSQNRRDEFEITAGGDAITVQVSR